MEVKKKTGIGKLTSKSNLVLKKHVGMIHCENRLSLLQRKICNILLFNALDNIEKKEIHEISLRQLCSLIEYRSNDLDLIKKSIKTLISTVMEWNLLDDTKYLNEESCSKDSLSWNASSLLAGATIEQGSVKYSYSPQIRSVLSSLDIYGRINLFVQARFNSSYSLALYENCVRFLNVGRTSWIDLGLFRSLMGLVDGQYPLFKELKRNVITSAITELNNKSDILIEAEFRKIGRQISGIRFHISENEGYKPKFKRIQSSTNSTDEHEKNVVSESLVNQLISIFGIQQNQATRLVKKYPENYIIEKMNFLSGKQAKNKAAYLIAAIKNDYKENENNRNQGRKISEYSREPVEESEARSLRKKYTQYKFSCYMRHFSRLEMESKITEEFIRYEKDKNIIMGEIYKKSGFKTLPGMLEFIEFIDKNYTNNKINFLEFDDYISADEETIYQEEMA